MDIEAVLLAGGASSRFGSDKSALETDGEGLARRIARLLSQVTQKVTILGGQPIEGHRHLPDLLPGAGPLRALSGFTPSANHVFVASCDLPRFDPRIVLLLHERLNRNPSVHATVPLVGHKSQPLCALYKSGAFQFISTPLAEGRSSMMSWLSTLWIEPVCENEITAAGVDPGTVMGFNTPEELATLLSGPLDQAD